MRSGHSIETSFNVYWMATLSDYDGAPDAKGANSLVGTGNTELDAVADLLDKLAIYTPIFIGEMMKFDLSKKAQFRLLKLAEHLRSLPPKAVKHFDMEHWMRHVADDDHRHVASGKEIKPADFLECGTTACALGWATTSPYFRRLGLRLVAGDYKFAEVRLGKKTRRAYDAFELAMEVFDLNVPAAHYFFRDINARSPKQWAREAEKRIA